MPGILNYVDAYTSQNVLDQVSYSS